MKVIVGCERSQKVTIALRRKGIKAYSCDIESCRGEHPEWHIQDDLIKVLGKYEDKFDAGIFFPPCTHLAISGAKHFVEKYADGRQEEAVLFFIKLWSCGIKKLGMENPVGIMSGQYLTEMFPHLRDYFKLYGFPKKPNQIIQPWQFGENASKKTCLWLRGFPNLSGTSIHMPRVVNGKRRWANQADGSGANKLGPSADRAEIRSITYTGIAEAMADQWF